MPYLYRRSSAPLSAFRHPPSFFLFLSSRRPLSTTVSPLRSIRHISPSLFSSPLTSYLASAPCHPRVGIALPPFAISFPFRFSLSYFFYLRLILPATFSILLWLVAKERRANGAIKSALIAAPDNSIPWVKIIGQEPDGVLRWAVPLRSIRGFASATRMVGRRR